MANFAGLMVVSFESRLSCPLSQLILKHGGVPVEAPALREIPIGENDAIPAFMHALAGGDFEFTLFETGVGVRYLTEAARNLGESRWPASLGTTMVIARGPKPATALRELGVRIGHQVPEPNTWRETLALLDRHYVMAGRSIAVQEYGKPSDELIAGLISREARLTRVPVYRWALPEDTGRLRAAIKQIADRQVGAVLFTSGQQVVHVLQVAEEEGCLDQIRTAFASDVVVGSIGPTTSEVLRAHGLPVDIEPVHPKMGHLVAAVASGWSDVGKPG